MKLGVLYNWSFGLWDFDTWELEDELKAVTWNNIIISTYSICEEVSIEVNITQMDTKGGVQKSTHKREYSCADEH